MITQSKSRSPRNARRWLPVALATAALGIAAMALLASGGQQPASAQPAIPAGYDLPSWQENGHAGRYLLKVTNGAPPAVGASVSGLVLTDTNCEPDAEGLNHCRNRIRLANGNNLYVINNHRMSQYRCLQPEETVSLTTFGNGWVVALTAEAGSN